MKFNLTQLRYILEQSGPPHFPLQVQDKQSAEGVPWPLQVSVQTIVKKIKMCHIIYLKNTYVHFS